MACNLLATDPVPQELFWPAWEARRWTMDYAQAADLLQPGEGMRGLCAVASFEIRKRLSSAQIPAALVHCDGHVLVRARLGGTWLIDVTANQFNEDLPDVWFPMSMRYAQSRAPFYPGVYCPLKQAWSDRGIRALLGEWPAREVHPDLKHT